MAKNILLTGASGFIGKYLHSSLESSGYIVFPFSKTNGFDICNKDSFNFFLDKEIDTVYHLAGNTYVPESWNNPSGFYKTNTLGTQNVLDFCRKENAKIIYISAYIYGVPRYLPINENHPVQPNNPYAHSKYLGEEICRFYSSNFGLKSIILRPFNLYGLGQSDIFLIPTILKQMKSGKITVKDDIPKRDYLYINDFIKACISCLDYQENSITFNIGSGTSYSVGEIVDIIKSAYSKNIEYVCLNEKRQNEIIDTIADCTLIKTKLGWKPEINFQEAIEKMVKSYE
jgi:nucleoside-diphosphate-sugar epimerase